MRFALVLLPLLFDAPAAVRISEDLGMGTELDVTGSDDVLQQGNIKVFEQAVEAGDAIVKAMTCDDLSSKMTEAVTKAEQDLSTLLEAPDDEVNVVDSSVVESSEMIMALVTQADKQKCVAEVMTKLETVGAVQALLQNHLSQALLTEQKAPPYCVNGIIMEEPSRWGSLTCCDKSCGVCTQEVSDDNITCDQRDGGASKCCPATIYVDHRNAPSYNHRYCNDREATGCAIPAETDPGRLLEEAYGYLLAWQQGTADLAGPDLERSLLFPEDVEDPANCPSPCQVCTRSHNSWRKGGELFKFKCLLNSWETPADERLACDPPRRRRSFWRPHRYGRKTWCKVEGWKASVCNQLRVSSLMSCGIRVIMSPFEEPAREYDHREKTIGTRTYTYNECVKREMRMETFDSSIHVEERPRLFEHVPRRNHIAFSMILSLGLANGLAALREGSKLEPNGAARSLLLQPFLQESREVDPKIWALFNGTVNEHEDDLETCDTDFLERCRPQWKASLANFPSIAFAFASQFLITGFWTAFWGGLTLFANSMLLAAIGWASTTAGMVYLAVVTSVAAAFGFTTSVFHCELYVGLTPWLCRSHRGGCEGYGKVAPYGHETWTQLLDEATTWKPVLGIHD